MDKKKRDRGDDDKDEKIDNGNADAEPMDEATADNSPSPKKERVIIPHVRDIIEPKPWSAEGSYCKIITWNVAGLRGVLKNSSNVLERIVQRHNPDIICLQETKLQSSHTSEFEHMLPDYHSYWTCSEVKKGYSGNAVFIKKFIPKKHVEAALASSSTTTSSTSTTTKKKSKQTTLFGWAKPKDQASASVREGPSSEPLHMNEHISIDAVKFELEDSRFTGEGRTITIDLGLFYVVACYVPNSGEGLKRLDYRVKEWDPYMRDYLVSLRARKPVIFTGDLNVGHLDLDIHNPTAKHIAKQSGLTPEERNSFSVLLSSGFKDAFRFLYPGRIMLRKLDHQLSNELIFMF
jgi:exonuclease III